MRHLVLYVNKNTEGKKDGDEFAHEAHAYVHYHQEHSGAECVPVVVPCHVPALRRPAAVENAIGQACGLSKEPFEVFAFFGHGTQRWIQTGHTLLNLPSLVAVLSKVLTRDPVIWWAACKTAADNPHTLRKGETSRGGILQQLVLRLLEQGVSATAWGHTTAGHTTRNPNLACITPYENTQVTREEKKILQKALWDVNSSARFQFPLCCSIGGLLEKIGRKNE